MSEGTKFFQNENVAVAKIVKQELVEATRKYEGTEYKIPRLVLTHEVVSKVSDPRKPYDLALRQPLPEGETKLVKVNVDFIAYDDDKGRKGLARNLEALKIPDDWNFTDFVNDDGSAPNINLVGQEQFLKVTVKEYDGKESVFWNLHAYTFEPTKSVPLTQDVAKLFKRNAYGSVSDLRKELRKEKEDKAKTKNPVLRNAAANDIPF